MFGQPKLLVRIGAASLVTAALIFAMSHAAVSDPSPNLSPKFTITSTISSSATSQVPALLYPGVQNYLWYNISNSQLVAITVQSLGISNVTAPPDCPLSNLNFSATTFSGALSIPAQGTNSVAEPISLYDTHTDQDSCEGATFNFTFAGTASYTEVYSTASAVTSSANPSLEGDSVVYTATVTAVAMPDQDAIPSSPTGTVTFMDGISTICSDVPIVSTEITTATATCSPFAYSSQGTHLISAIYSNADGNFLGSTSPGLSQVVDP